MNTDYCVIFDMDGVLFDTERLTFRCWQKLTEPYGLDDFEEAYKQVIGMSALKTKEIFGEYYQHRLPVEALYRDATILLHEEIDRSGPPKKPYVGELLTWLKQEKIRTAIASSTATAQVRKEVKMAGLDGLFDAIIGGDQVTRGKPEPDIFLKACEALRGRPERCVVIEDSKNGIRAAHKAGMIPYMVPDMIAPTEEIRALCAEVLPDLHEVQIVLQQTLRNS